MTKKTELSELVEYTKLLNGAHLYLLPITQDDLQTRSLEAEKRFEEEVGLIEQPWYWTVEPDADGKGGEKVLWTAKDVSKDGTPEEKEAWKVFEQNQAKQNTFIEDRVFRFVLTEGTSKLVTRSGNELDLVIDPVTLEWQPPRAWLDRLNGNTPTDPYELKFLYLSPMVKDVDTRRKIVSRCNLLTLRGLVSEEDLERYDRIFRTAMAQIGARFNEITEEPEGGDEPREPASLDVLVQDDGTTDGAGLAENTE